MLAPEPAASPAVSVLMPVCGAAPFLGSAFDSIARQSGVDFEVICIDDGAAPCARRLLFDLAARDSRLRVVPSPGRGISDALNQGLALARGRFVARMDADDVSLPGRLAMQAAYLDAHPEIGVLGAQALLIDAEGNGLGAAHVPVGTDRVARALQISAALIHPTVMMRRSLVVEVGGYRRLFDGAEDFELWLRLRSRTRLDNLPQPLLLYRQHEDQVTVRRQFRQARLVGLALVSDRLRRTSGLDVLAGLDTPKGWRAAIASASVSGFRDVRCLTASHLADNGGTLRASGARYLRQVCRAALGHASPEICRRLALACVRHQLQLMRSGRWREAVLTVPSDLARWRLKLVAAYWLHASILWRSRRQFWQQR